MLRASCFKHLVELKGLQLSSQILHLLIMRISKTMDGETFWFIIGDKPIRYIISEFILVSGLKVGHARNTDKTIAEVPRLVSRYLNKPIKRGDMLDAFNNCNVDQTEKYKLGLIVILSYVLMGSEENTTIKWWWFALVDDLEKFNEYPWANSSYELTTKVLKRCLKSTFTGKNAYTLHGFPLSIMVWALEAIPAIASLAEKVETENVPRLLNWKVDKKLMSVDIDTVLEAEHVDLKDKLQPNEVEKQQPYWVCLEYFLEENRIHSQQAEARIVEPVLDHQMMKDLVRSVVREENENIYSILHRIEAKYDTMLMSSRVSSSRGVQVNLDDVDGAVDAKDNLIRGDEECDVKDGENIDGEKCVYGKGHEDVDVESRDFEVIQVVGEERDILHWQSKKRKAKHLVSPVDLEYDTLRKLSSLDPSKRSKLECVTDYDPFRELDLAKLDYLNNWLLNNRPLQSLVVTWLTLNYSRGC